MGKRLNATAFRQALAENGLNAAGLAERLGVSREAVSKWAAGESFPRPDKLLRLGSALRLSFSDLVLSDEEEGVPVVAFRRMKGTKTTDGHLEHAKEMGRALKALVPLLPFDTLTVPPTLKEPVVDFEYLTAVAENVRQSIHLSADDQVDFRHLIARFRELQTVLIPVLWGKKDRHENALHIFLPDSGTTWVYLNLDVHVHDFKFWMAHELGHSLAPKLESNKAEDFADAFAATLLFPRTAAEKAYAEIEGISRAAQLRHLTVWAERFVISPYHVYRQVNAFAKSVGKAPIHLEPDIHAVTTNFNKGYKNVADALFDGQIPRAEQYLKVAASVFETPFFDVLGKYLRKSGTGPGYVQTALDCGVFDAKTIHSELV